MESNVKIENIESRLECSICLEYLKDAIQTSCGHKFCAKCINSWMNDKNKKYCPIDEVTLTEGDIFIDNFTRREILSRNKKCPHSTCSALLNILEYESHVTICKHKQTENIHCEDEIDSSKLNILKSPSKSLKLTLFSKEDLNKMDLRPNNGINDELFYCKFYDAGCNEIFKSKPLLNKHYELKMSYHLELLYAKVFTNLLPNNIENGSGVPNGVEATNGNVCGADQLNTLEGRKQKVEEWVMKNKDQETKLWEPAKQNQQNNKGGSTNDMDNSGLLRLLYERIVLLEQGKLELEIKVNKLESQLKELSTIEENVLLRVCNGVYYWRISNFVDKLKTMRENPSHISYSPCFYTSQHGYRFCARINMSRENPEFLSLFIHLVQGENDNLLEWPFTGKIIFTAISTNPEKCVEDELQSDTNLDSFKRPLNHYFNKRAFGIINFIKCSDVLGQHSTFLIDNMFILKIHIFEGFN